MSKCVDDRRVGGNAAKVPDAQCHRLCRDRRDGSRQTLEPVGCGQLRGVTDLVIRYDDSSAEHEREQGEDDERNLPMKRKSREAAARPDVGHQCAPVLLITRPRHSRYSAPSWPSPFSSDRHKYQLATELCGLHFAPIFKTSFGVGRFRLRYARLMAFW